jgi:DNA primase
VGILAEDIEAVRSATDLVALVSERVALKRVGRRWVGLCPFHAENTPSFSVNGELGVYYCFGCHAHGDAITYLREAEKLDFTSAVEHLAQRAGVPLRYDAYSGPGERGAGAKKKAELTEALERAIAWYHERLLSAPDAAGARKYLRSRGYDAKTVRHYKLGWAPAGQDTLCREAGISVDLLEGAGLAQSAAYGAVADFFKGRVLFPIYDPAGRPVGIGGRVLPGGVGPKYKNTQATALYDKSRVLYGLNWAKGAIVERDQVVICEGYTDVIGLHRCGVAEAVATCGTALAEGHVKLLSGFTRRIVLAYDADAAGQGAAERVYEWEKRFQADILVAELPAGADPADLAQADPEMLRKCVSTAVPFLAFRLQRLFSTASLATPESRARVAEAGLALIGEHPDPLVRDQYLMQVADRCRLPPEELRSVKLPRPRKGAQGPTPRLARPSVPLPEREALLLAVHCPESIAGRIEASFFGSSLARAAYERLAEAMTLHEAIGGSSDEVAALLSELAASEPVASADDVVRRLVDRAAVRALAELERSARAAGDLDVAAEAELAGKAKALKLALEELRSVEAAPGQEEALAKVEAHLLTLLRG